MAQTATDYRKQIQFVVLAFAFTLVTLILSACGGQNSTVSTSTGSDLDAQTQIVPVEGGSYTDVSVDGLAAMLENKDFPLINVHTPYEGEIEGTDEFIPFNEIEQNLDKLPAGKDAQIVLYCRSGSMSAQAAQALVELGYTDVWNVDGGMIAWRNSGRPLQNN
jgi:rhodanese-related sulfurtransferase